MPRVDRNLRLRKPAATRGGLIFVATPGPLELWQRVEGVTWVRYDDADDWVVNSPVSGEVHLVNDAAHRLWMLASGDDPRTLQHLVTLFAAEIGRPADDELRAATTDNLAFMEEAGILRAVQAGS